MSESGAGGVRNGGKRVLGYIVPVISLATFVTNTVLVWLRFSKWPCR